MPQPKKAAAKKPQTNRSAAAKKAAATRKKNAERASGKRVAGAGAGSENQVSVQTQASSARPTDQERYDQRQAELQADREEHNRRTDDGREERAPKGHRRTLPRLKS